LPMVLMVEGHKHGNTNKDKTPYPLIEVT
jgi:hypothetical protein